MRACARLWVHPDLWFWRGCHFCFLKHWRLVTVVVITKCSCVSILDPAFHDRWRPATHPALRVGGLLDRPPSWQAGRCQSHPLSPRNRSRTLRHHGEGQRGQNLSGVFLFSSTFWSPKKRCQFFLSNNPLVKCISLQYHHSFTAVDSCLGPLVLSVCLEEEENRLRVILRCSFFTCISPVCLWLLIFPQYNIAGVWASCWLHTCTGNVTEGKDSLLVWLAGFLSA